MKGKTSLVFPAIFIVPMFETEALAVMMGEHYLIPTCVVSNGGATMTSARCQTTATLGQSTPWMDHSEPPHSGSYDLYPGFWYTLELNPPAMLWMLILLGTE